MLIIRLVIDTALSYFRTKLNGGSTMRSSSGTFPFRDNNGTVWLGFADWGTISRDNLLLCVHGHTRQGRDFKKLAEFIAAKFHTIGFDLAGHGKSGWLADKTDYSFETSMRHIDGLMDYRGISQIDWIGTFTGGILGMMFAARENSPVRRLILNDIGPFVSNAAIEQFISRIGSDVVLKNLESAITYFKDAYFANGIIDEADWSDFITRSINREVDGSYSLHYDPAILDELNTISGDLDLWDVYEKIECPVLVLRGKHSNMLSEGTAARMRQTGPKAQLIEFENCGHAPALTDPDQLTAISDWLSETEMVPEMEEVSIQNEETVKDQNVSEIKVKID